MITTQAAASPTRRADRPLRHIITSEYSPQPGGVSDYTRQVAEGLVQAGEEVHVWCPASDPLRAPAPRPGVVHIHRELGHISPRNLNSVGEQLDRFPAPRRILVQWVPHGYGRRSMNVPFCLWLWRRARNGDVIEIMVHEAFLTFEGSWRQYGAALVHRLMTVILMQACSRAWFSAAECQRRWESCAMGRPHIPFQLLPIPSNIPVQCDEPAIQAVRRRYRREGALLVGHFGTYGAPVRSVLEPIVSKIALEIPDQPLLLMGRGSEDFRQHLIEHHPALQKSLYATGPLSPQELSCHIAACDLLIQPYPDGATTRRTSLMVGLSHAKPVLTTSSPVSEPLWGESAAVGLVPSGEPAAFVKLLGELLENPAERARLSNAARKLYHDRFDISHTIAALRLSTPRAVACAS